MQLYIFLWLASKDYKKYEDDVTGDRTQIKSQRANTAMRQNLSQENIILSSKYLKTQIWE